MISNFWHRLIESNTFESLWGLEDIITCDIRSVLYTRVIIKGVGDVKRGLGIQEGDVVPMTQLAC